MDEPESVTPPVEVLVSKRDRLRAENAAVRAVVAQQIDPQASHRQHRRLADAGIEVSRPWLTNLVHGAAALLEPVYDAQLEFARQIRVKAMDENPIRTGTQGQGEIKVGYFWPVYGERDEIVFRDFPTRASRAVREALGEGGGPGRERRRAPMRRRSASPQRSDYPLFCTIAQNGQVLDVLHRSGNVHDSNGAEDFIAQCFGAVQQALPGVRIELRMDSAFFSETIVERLDELGVEHPISVPFERLSELKSRIEKRRLWRPIPTWLGNRLYLLAALLAHNLAREMQMIAHPAGRATTAKRPTLWRFASLGTLRKHLLHRAGRLIRPQGRLTLPMTANTAVKNHLLHFLHPRSAAA